MVYRRRYRYRNKDKYSIEQTCIYTSTSANWPVVAADPDNLTQESRQFSISVTPPTTIQGMRKVKHLTLSLSNYTSTGESIPIVYAIVYVPQGYEPQPINYPAADSGTSLYPANQFVMSSGVIDFSGGPCRIRTPLSRNLNSGDSIQLIAAVPSSQQNASFVAHIKYAITLQ